MTDELKQVIRKYHKVEAAWVSADKNSAEYLSAVCLLEYPSYRLKESDKEDVFIGFRTFIRTLRRMLMKPSGLRLLDPSGKSVIVGGPVSINDIISYIQRSGKAAVHTYLSRDSMSLASGKTWRNVLLILPFALRQSLRSIRSQYRQSLALSITEVVEIAFLLNFLRKNNIEIVYDFLPYEVDSNFMYLLLKEHGKHVIKVPSSGPLATHHKILISDDVVFSTPYHYEEFAKFQKTFRIDQQLLWPPERSHTYYSRYKDIKPQTTPLTLGFYSHGEWLRKEEKHSAYGGRIGDAETAILGFLGRYITEHPEFSLFIFPHPREMRSDVSEKRNAYYRRTIGHDNFRMSTWVGGTSQHFDKADIAVAAFSTILYERLFCGYKTLIGNMYIFEFPMNKSALNNICFKSFEEMSAMIGQFAQQSEAYFFEKTGLQEYQLQYYPEP